MGLIERGRDIFKQFVGAERNDRGTEHDEKHYDERLEKIKAESKFLLSMLQPVPRIEYTDEPLTRETASHVTKPRLDVIININDPQSIIHEFAHYLDYTQIPNLAEEYEFQWIINAYREQIQTYELTWGDKEYYCLSEEIFARLFQQWHQDIDPRIDYLRMDANDPGYDESHIVAEKLYREMPEVEEFFLKHCAELFNKICEELELDTRDMQH